jgi:hypothetical protein
MRVSVLLLLFSLGVVGAAQMVSIEPGTFDLWVGTDSTANEHTTFEVLPP